MGLLKTIDGTRPENLHFKWSASNRPVETVEQGERFKVIIPDSSTMEIRPDFTVGDLQGIDGSKLDGAVGPIFINGAEPGDALEIELLDITTGTWGWTAIIRDFGFLKNRYPEELVIWDLKDGYATTRGDFLKGIRIPLDPFLGIIGVAPHDGEHGMIPPRTFGGNMDNRLLKKGSRLMVPVYNDGALLSFADPHGAQGDGEVCGTAIETSAEITATVKVHKNRNLRYPMLFSRESFSQKEIVTMGISADLKEGAETAVLEMIDFLSGYGLSQSEGYALCSVAGNLRISEIVDEPNFVVSMVMPENLLPGKSD